MNPTLPITETIKSAWSKVKSSKSTFFIVFVCYIASYFIPVAKIFPHEGVGKILIAVASIGVIVFITYPLQWSLFYLGIQRAMDMNIKLNMIKQAFKLNVILKMFGYVLLIFAIMLVPCVFLWLPKLVFLPIANSSFIGSNLNTIMKLLTALSYILGMVTGVFAFYLVIRFKLVYGLILMKGLNPWAAIKASYKATQSNVCRIILLLILMLFILAVSAFSLGIAYVWTVPFCLILYGEIYKRLVVMQE